MLGNMKVGTAEKFSQIAQKSLANYPSAADTLLKEYGITSGLDDDTAFAAVAHFGNDICFHAPTTQFASGWPGKCYVYHFNIPNPWEGPWKGVSGHIFDVATLFMNLNEQLPPEARSIAEKFSEHVILYINGKEPFPLYGGEQGTMIYGPPGSNVDFIVGNDVRKKGRSGILVQLADEIGYDALIEVFTAFASTK
jgi:hypothetical protein